jgi:ArsR family transcriptional regulator
MPDAKLLTWKETRRLAECFAGLSHELRVEMLHLLAATAGELSVLEIAQRVVVPTNEVSHHLRKLLAAGLVERRTVGRQLYYRVSGRWASQLIGAAVAGLLPIRTDGDPGAKRG